MSLSGKKVLVTGGAHGIGRAMVEEFRARGAVVLAVDINEEGLKEIGPGSDEVQVHVADISTPDGALSAINAIGEELDILCNNAGIVDRLALVDEVSEAEWNRVIAVNLTGPFLLCHYAVPRMVKRGGGVIVNTSSVAGLRGGRAGAAYTSSKFGLVGLTMNIAATFGSQGIRCNAICPGSTATGIPPGIDPSSMVTPRGELLITRDRDKPPPATPQEIAKVAVFLASDEAARINGAALPVDGGWIAY